MKIFYSSGSDPMLLDSVEGLNSLHKSLNEFIESGSRLKRFEAVRTGSPEPYQTFLPYFEVEVNDGPVKVEFGNENGLRLIGNRELLEKCIKAFRFKENEDGQHHHPIDFLGNDNVAPGTLGLIVEADDYYINEYQNER